MFVQYKSKCECEKYLFHYCLLLTNVEFTLFQFFTKYPLLYKKKVHVNMQYDFKSIKSHNWGTCRCSVFSGRSGVILPPRNDHWSKEHPVTITRAQIHLKQLRWASKYNGYMSEYTRNYKNMMVKNLRIHFYVGRKCFGLLYEGFNLKFAHIKNIFKFKFSSCHLFSNVGILLNMNSFNKNLCRLVSRHGYLFFDQFSIHCLKSFFVY